MGIDPAMEVPVGVNIRESRGKLYLDIYWNGKRHWESLHLTLGQDKNLNKETYRLADVIRQKRELQLVSGDHGLLDPIEGKRSLVSYAEELAEKQNPKNALPKSLRYLREYAGTIHISAVNERWLEGYQSFLKEQPAIGLSTVSKYWSAITFVLKRAVRDRIIPRNPAEAVKGVTAPEVVKTFLSVDELEKLAATELKGELGAEVKRAFMFGVFTGLRVSDLRSLTWGDIDLDPRQLLKRQEKTKRVVAVPLHETAWSLIKEDRIHRRDELVFPRLSESQANTNQYLTTWAKHAGIDKQLGWHIARHTFATLALENGADIATVSRLLGHTKLATTMIYAKSSDNAKKRAIEGLPSIEVNKSK